MPVPLLGAKPPPNAIESDEAYVLFEDAPSKAGKAALKTVGPWTVSFDGRVMAVKLPKRTRSRTLTSLLNKAHKVHPIVLAYRRVRTSVRTRSEPHQAALEVASEHLAAFDTAVASTKNGATRRMATAVLAELCLADANFPVTDAQRRLVEPELEAARSDRHRDFFHTSANRSGALLEVLDEIVWDEADALACLDVLVTRMRRWGEQLDGVLLQAAADLGARIPKVLSESLVEGSANALWLAFAAGLAQDVALTRRLRPLVKRHGGDASVDFVYGDLRRGRDDRRLVRLADTLLTPDAAALFKAGCWVIRRDPIVALDLFDRTCREPEPPWEAANNGVAMLLKVHEGKLPPKLAKTWLTRIEPLSEAAARHNTACLLARLGRHEQAKSALLEAIAGGADLEAIQGDDELRALLDDEEIAQALGSAPAPKKQPRRKTDRGAPRDDGGPRPRATRRARPKRRSPRRKPS